MVGVVAAKLIPAPVADITPPVETRLEATITDTLPEPEITPEIIPAPTATPSSLLNLRWKTYSAENYKLYYPQSWLFKYTADKLTLTKGKNLITLSPKGEETGAKCDESSIHKIKKGLLVWDIQESNASASTFYVVCDNGLPTTSIGSVTLWGDGINIDQNTIDEFKLMMEKIEIMESTPSAGMMKEEQV